MKRANKFQLRLSDEERWALVQLAEWKKVDASELLRRLVAAEMQREFGITLRDVQSVTLGESDPVRNGSAPAKRPALRALRARKGNAKP